MLQGGIGPLIDHGGEKTSQPDGKPTQEEIDRYRESLTRVSSLDGKKCTNHRLDYHFGEGPVKLPNFDLFFNIVGEQVGTRQSITLIDRRQLSKRTCFKVEFVDGPYYINSKGEVTMGESKWKVWGIFVGGIFVKAFWCVLRLIAILPCIVLELIHAA